MKRIRLFLLLILSASALRITAYAQTDLEESIFDDTDQAVSAALLDELEAYRRHPVNINSCGLERLAALPFLTPVTARAIYRERRSRGMFLNWDDFTQRLSSVLGETDALRTVVCFRSGSASGGLHFRSRLKRSIRTGVPSSGGPGRKFALQQRLTVSLRKRVSAALIIAKDAGERSFADHAAGFISWTAVSHHLTLLAGDYCLETGQGLSGWGPFAPPKGAEPGSHVIKQARGIRGYASGDENRFLRGAAASALIGPFRIAAFASRRRLDAVISDDGVVTSTPLSGLHISASEQRNKDRLLETVGGTVLEYRFAAGCFGVTASGTTYGTPFGATTREDGCFAFQGRRNTVRGCHMILDLPFCSAAAEIARSSAGGAGWIFTLLPRYTLLPLVISIHRFDPRFHNPRSNCAGESPAVNSSGVYLACSRSLLGRDRISWYCDLSRTPWRTYTLPATNYRYEQFLEYRTRLGRSLRARGRIRMKQSRSARAAAQQDDPAKQTGERVQMQYRLQTTWRYARASSLQVRYEYTHIRYRYFQPGTPGTSPGEGRLLYFRWRYTGLRRLRMTSRFTLFDTQGWDARIYLLENSVPGTMHITALSGKGAAWISTLTWIVSDSIHLCAAVSLQASGPCFNHPTKKNTVFTCQTELSL